MKSKKSTKKLNVKKPVKKIVRVSKPRIKSKKKVVKKTIIKKVVRKTIKKIVSRKKITTKKTTTPFVEKFKGNPIIGPSHDNAWENEAAFNPAVILHEGRVHLFYRALGGDGMSRIGYTSSDDGIHFDARSPYPVYSAENINKAKKHYPNTSPARLIYDTGLYASGGGWGGCEDPRTVKIDGRVYLTFNIFNGWDSIRVAYISIDVKDVVRKNWNWSDIVFLSQPGDRQKNWILFPEKINGKFALFYNLDKGDPSRVYIKYMNELTMNEAPNKSDVQDPHQLPDHIVAWHNRTRSAAAPPIRTSDGWLLLYHAMDKNDSSKYKVGAMILDINDPTKVLYRAQHPIIEPDEWYENDWKPGIVYASGALVKDGTLFIYYGGGDKRIALATVNLNDFLRRIKEGQPVIVTKKSLKKK